MLKKEGPPVLEELKNGTKVVGVKQTRRALHDGTALRVYYASDADPSLWGPIAALCGEKGIPVTEVAGKRELGLACSIAVGAAVAALLQE